MTDLSFQQWIQQQVDSESYWFQKLDLGHGIVTPGWSDPSTDKLPYYGLPADFKGKRVLDVGCAEGFFSFEAERRGASQVVAVDSYPDSIRRFNIARAALGSKVTAYLTNVYDLDPRTYGTFDVVMFFGVFYHLKHPLLALEKLLKVCSGTLLMQTATFEHGGMEEIPLVRFYPHGMRSGPAGEKWDPTIFFRPNEIGVVAMLDSAGFENIEVISTYPNPNAFRATSPVQAKGRAPDHTKAPWS